MKRILVLTTHPIQYNAPLFRLLAKEYDLLVLYTWSQRETGFFDRSFGKDIQWDIPLLEGYSYEFVKNISPRPGSHHFWGIVNPSILKRIRRFNPDYRLVYGWNLFTHLLVIKWFRKRKILFRGDSSILDMGGDLRSRFKQRVLRWVYRSVSCFLYTGENNRQYFKACGVPDRKLLFAPHAVENERFFDSPDGRYEAEASKWRRELGIEEDQVVILFAGKFEAKKDPSLLIRAFMHLDDPSSRLILVGNGPLEAPLKQLAAGHPGIQFLPFQNQSKMPLVYRLGDLFCYPSKGPAETWGLSVNEAMACSRPVLVSDRVGCAVDLVKDGATGMIFRHGDENDLAKKMKEMVRDRAKLKKMGDHARKIIGNWSYQKDIEAVQRIINMEHSVTQCTYRGTQF